MAITLAKIEGELLGETSRYVEANAKVDTLHDNLVDPEVRTLGDRLSHVQFEALGFLYLRYLWWRPQTNKK